MQIEGNRFLVIGGAGFIGSHVVERLLAEGASHVRVYDNFSRGTRANLHKSLLDSRAEIFSDGGDILHKDILLQAMDGIDGVFHLAAMWLLHCEKYPRAAYDVNVTGSMNVFEAAVESGIKKIVFSSSASVYGNQATSPIYEQMPLSCNDFYGASKAASEFLLRALFHRNATQKRKFSYIGLRYMNVYGPRQYVNGGYINVIARMLQRASNGMPPIIYGDGRQLYDFIDVRDCARANLLAMMSKNEDLFCNVGTGVGTTLNELALKICNLFGGNILPVYQQIQRPMIQSRIGAPKMAAETINFTSKYSLNDSLTELVNELKYAK